MIAKILLGVNVKGLLQYLTDKKHMVLTANNLFPESNIENIVSEIRTIQDLNTRAKKNVMHIVLSFPKNETISDEKLKIITEDFMNEFGANNNQWITFKHFDTVHHHCHTAINRVGIDGKLLSDSHTHLKAKRICRALEIKYKLNEVSNYKLEDKNKNKMKLKSIIDLSIKDCNTLKELKETIEKQNYKVLIGRGIAFVNKTNGIKLKGSDIGRAYSLKNILQKINDKEKYKNGHLKSNDDELKDITVESENKGTTIDLLSLLDSKTIAEELQVDLFKKKKRKKRKL